MKPDGLTLHSLKRLLTCACALAALAFAASAQPKTGSLKGNVTDEQGGLVVNATLTLRDAKGAETSAATNDEGAFEFKNIAAGVYTLRVAAPGFASFDQKIEVKAGRATAIDVQLGVTLAQESVTVEDKGVSTDSDRNADAVVLSGKDLEALPNDPEALSSALQALAGPPSGDQQGAQVKVDGFSNGQIPPKEAIREVRINQNPYAAENEYPGWGGIEIFTQPGSDKWHGSAAFGFNDESLNSRNPFAPRRAPYQQRVLNLYLSGPVVKKRASFTVYGGRFATDLNSVVNATVLDAATLLPTLFNRSFVTPQISLNGGARADLKINKQHTLVGNYSFNRSAQDLAGFGGFSLPSRAYRSENTYHTIQLTETAVLNERTINETRFQYNRSTSRQTGDNSQPALNVLDSFFGGGSQVGHSSYTQDHTELQNFTSLAFGNHFFKAGGRLRNTRVVSLSQSNFGGTYTFAGGLAPVLDASDQIVAGAGGQPQLVEISSLERYRRTLLFARRGLTASQIRALGGGATQFSVAGGEPEARVTQTDISLYAQDDWKLRPHLTVSPGLRYENQTNIDSNLNFAPRLGFAWAPTFGHKKATPPAAKSTASESPATKSAPSAAEKNATPSPSAPASNSAASSAAASSAAPSKPGAPPTSSSAPSAPSASSASSSTATQNSSAASAASSAQGAKAAPSATVAQKPPAPPAQPKTVFRGGIGIFYNRISEDLTLQARRFNGVTQQQYVVSDPSVLDLFPSVPPLALLNSFALPQTRRFVSPLLDPPYSVRMSFSVERQLPRGIKVSLSYSHSHSLRSIRTVNVNAPLAGTFDPLHPAGGVRPLGAAAGNVLEYESNGQSKNNSVSVSANGRIGKVNFWTTYTHSKTDSKDNGTSGSPFDAYDFSGEWGRAAYDIRHFFYAGGDYSAPHGFSLNFFAIANSGTPFNITTGRDTNGDTFFSERPAFATDLTKPGVVVTPYGALDPNPSPGARIIPRYFAQGPGFFTINMGLSKVYKFGHAIETKNAPPVASGNVTTDVKNPKPAPKQPVQRPYQLTFSLYASNLLNHTNRANPVGNMASPYFLRSTAVSSMFIFGPGGAGGASGNRQILLRVGIRF